MLASRAIAAGSRTTTSGAVEHWLTQTLRTDDLTIARYYERQDTLGVLRPDLSPVVAERLGIDTTRPLAKAEIENLVGGRRTDGGPIEGKHYAKERALPVDPKTGMLRHSTPIGSVDIAVSPHKSVSVAYALATSDAERAAIFTAHIEAARAAVGQVAEERGHIRLGRGGLSGTMPGDVSWLEFTHRTVRKVAGDPDNTPGDPGLHTHFVMQSAVVGRDGRRVGSLDTGRIERALYPADSRYQAQLATNLRRAGFDVVLDEQTGAARMTAISDDLCVLFSKRQGRGEELARAYVAERGQKWSDLDPHQRNQIISAITQSREQRQRGGRDDLADFDGWRRQAKDIGWEAPASLKHGRGVGPELDQAQRLQQAYERSLPYLRERFEKRSVLPEHEIRVAAGRGLVAAGMNGADEIGQVVDLMRQKGVWHHGERTPLVYATEADRRSVSLTTAKHIADEREFVRLASIAAKDTGLAIPRDLLERKVAASGLDFSDEHGKAQRAAIERLSESRFALLVAASGAGKTAALSSLVAAWQEQGRNVIGTSLAWRQADALQDAGIQTGRAFSVLLDDIAAQRIKLNSRSVVVIDEVGQLGTQQGLALLTAQEKIGFTIVAIGDDKQTQAVAAGNFIALARRATGETAEIETTRRQQTERERQIASLFRQGEGAEAIRMKREDGTARMIEGSRGGVIDAVAKLYRDRLQATGQAPTISAPTNADAHQIGEAVRRERRDLGLLGPDRVQVSAIGGQGGQTFRLPLAEGELVRLFANARPDGIRGGTLGRNGSVLEVVAADEQGLTLRAKSGFEGRMSWSGLMDKASGRVALDYAYALTIHTAQGLTTREHINALPSGSKGIDGGSLYTADTRHQVTSYLIANSNAEGHAVRQGRPLYDPRPVTADDKWAQVASAFSRHPEKDTATSLLGRAASTRRDFTHGFQDAAHQPERPQHRPDAVLYRQMERLRELPQHVMKMVQRTVERAAELYERSRGIDLSM